MAGEVYHSLRNSEPEKQLLPVALTSIPDTLIMVSIEPRLTSRL